MSTGEQVERRNFKNSTLRRRGRHWPINDAIVANVLIGCEFGSPRPFT
ncbi:MAG: hypothetical protein ACLP8S_16445 [Solirubrobacteraceae bacterium]